MLVIISVFVFFIAGWQKTKLPEQRYHPSLQEEPKQTETLLAPFSVEAGKMTYNIKPLYDYELYGLVVSKHDSNAWDDFLHKEQWQDYLNVADLCVIWGSNIQNESYKKVKFSSGQWTCYYQTKDRSAWELFNPFKISNNHLLTANKFLAEKIRDVEIGDQIYIRGYLAEYSHHQGFFRGSSISRQDSGNGACETIYIDGFKIIQKRSGVWKYIQYLSVVLFLLSLWMWFRQPFQVFEDDSSVD